MKKVLSKLFGRLVITAIISSAEMVIKPLTPTVFIMWLWIPTPPPMHPTG